MTKEEIIRNLKYTIEKHKNDRVDTFGTNISVMCKDILDYLEQEPILDKIKAEITTLQNRCYSLTKGTMCAFCEFECNYKAESEKQE